MSLTQDQQILAGTFAVPFETPEQLKDWIFNFLDLDLPIGHIDPDSNSSPVDWLFEAYSTIRHNHGSDKPSFVVYAPREGYKTLACAALEVIAMVHFNLTVAHMAAIESQSKKSVQYINTFLKKLQPYLAHHGREIISQNAKNLTITNKTGDVAYLTIIICTMAGANSEHTNMMVVDEIDVVRFPQAYEEAKLIPGMLRGRFPVTILTSTRKFAFGFMQKEIDMAKELNQPVLHWNIIDITERCQPDRHMPELPKEVRYTAKRLPLRNISEDEYSQMLDERKAEYNRIEAFAGCAKCKLLPVCKTRLATRPENDIGGLYKPIPFTINQFSKVSPDMGEAQLMCWKPSSTGLIYPRYDEEEIAGNTLTLIQAWKAFTGTEPKKNLELSDIIDLFHRKGIQFYVGGDWGYKHCYALIAGAILPNGEFWIFETFAMSGLEFPDMMKYAKYFRDKYKPKRWFMDTAMPMFIATFRRNKMPCKDFKKDILGGIESIRGQIVNAENRRALKVLKTKENEFLIKGFRHHHFKLDAQGNITTDPDDEEYADVMDALRYMGQNLFASKGSVRVGSDAGISARESALRAQRNAMYSNNPDKMHSDLISSQIRKLAKDGDGSSKGKSEGGSVLWDFSEPLDKN